MKQYLLISLLFIVVIGNAQPVVSIIPQPNKIVKEKGYLQLNSSFAILTSSDQFPNEIEIFNNEVKDLLGFEFSTGQKASSKKTIELTYKKLESNEAYSLSITKSKITITGSNTGVFYGLQSLYQLIAANSTSSKEVTLPLLLIEDSPNYKWRGMHLDVCRHFFSKDEVKKYIDYLALYKLNTFHWHLTEDQGWRIEIKKYPLLTEIGSKRKGTIVGAYSENAPLDGVPHGGYYTQEDIKDVITYAQKRHITIVPEIEMPGHALAALSAYPQYSCAGGPFEPATTWGVFDDVFCAGNDSTFAFLEDVLTEVVAIFPGKYIHIGGDECPKTRWKTCSKCQQRIKNEGLKDEHALQSYFITRIEKFLNKNGKQIIGWDEILEGGLAPNAAVMSWRGTSGGIAAANLHHNVVMTPQRPCYFDHYQVTEKEREPLAIGGFNPLDSVYNYNPTPSALSAEERKFILGSQANVWTEYIPDFKQVEYMIFPRMCALSETLWTSTNKKDYSDFIKRLKAHSSLLDRKKINYAKHFLHTK